MSGSEDFILNDAQIVSLGASRDYFGSCRSLNPLTPLSSFGVFLVFKHILLFPALKLELTILQGTWFLMLEKGI